MSSTVTVPIGIASLKYHLLQSVRVLLLLLLLCCCCRAGNEPQHDTGRNSHQQAVVSQPRYATLKINYYLHIDLLMAIIKKTEG
jgi:hypothetical protein